MSGWEEGASREEGAAAQHARLQQAPRRPQEELHIMPACKLRQAGVQLCGDHHRSGQVGVHLHRARPSLSQRYDDTTMAPIYDGHLW